MNRPNLELSQSVWGPLFSRQTSEQDAWENATWGLKLEKFIRDCGLEVPDDL